MRCYCQAAPNCDVNSVITVIHVNLVIIAITGRNEVNDINGVYEHNGTSESSDISELNENNVS